MASQYKIASNFQRNLPRAIAPVVESIPQTGRAEFDLNKELSPQQAQLEYELYKTFGPAMNEIGQGIDRSNALADTETQLAQATGAGGQLVGQADTLQRQLDPEFYNNRALIGEALNKYLGGYDPNSLSAGEIEAINRGISAREGNMPDSALKTVKNAMTFGNAATERWKNFGNAITTATQALPQLRSGMSGLGIATRRNSGTNTGELRLTNPDKTDPTTAVEQNFGFANNLMSEFQATKRGDVAKRMGAFDKANSITGMVGTAVGAAAGAF